MIRRGMPYDEIVQACKPTPEDYQLLQAEIYEEREEEILEAEWVDCETVDPRPGYLIRPWFFWAVLVGVVVGAVDAVFRVFGI